METDETFMGRLEWFARTLTLKSLADAIVEEYTRLDRHLRWVERAFHKLGSLREHRR